MVLTLAIGLGMYVLTSCVLMVPTAIVIWIATSRHPRSLTRPSSITNFILLQLVSALVLFGHLVNIALWAVLFWRVDEFAGFEAAYYHSAVNYSSLGYGDVVMSKRWHLLGPLETINGIIMFGISTALIFALMMRLIELRLKAKPGELDDVSRSSGDRT